MEMNEIKTVDSSKVESFLNEHYNNNILPPVGVYTTCNGYAYKTPEPCKDTQCVISFDQALKEIGAFLKSMEIPFMVVGSLALKAAGLKLRRDPDDIDMEILVRPETSAIKSIFAFMSDAASNAYYKSVYDGPEATKPYVFNYKGIKINIWPFAQFSCKEPFMKNDISYSNVGTVLGKKKAYGRQKDFQDLAFMASWIIGNE